MAHFGRISLQIVYNLQPGNFELTVMGDQNCNLTEKSIQLHLDENKVTT
jgi:hypothetical protein